MHFKYRRQTVCSWPQRGCPLSEESDPSISRRRWWLFVSFIGVSEGHRTPVWSGTWVWPGEGWNPGLSRSHVHLQSSALLLIDHPTSAACGEVLPLVWEDDVRLERQGKITHPQQLNLTKQRDDSLKWNVSGGYCQNRSFSSQRDAFKFHNDLFAHKDFSAVKMKRNQMAACVVALKAVLIRKTSCRRPQTEQSHP